MVGGIDDRVRLVRKRADVLAALEGDCLGLRAVVEEADCSRSTANRAVRELEEAGLVCRAEDGYELTAVGRIGLEHYQSYRQGWADLVDAADVLDALPDETGVDVSVVAGSEPVAAPATTPYQPVERLHDAVRSADDCRAVLPAVGDPRTVRLLYEHVVTDGAPAELVVSPELQASLAEEFPRQLAAMAEDDFGLLVGEVPEVGVVITEHDGDDRVTLVVYGDEGGVSGVLQNDTAAAVRWAEATYADARAGAEPATDEVRQPDGGVAGASGPGSPPGLPVALEREGFVRLTREYFVDREVADPTTAWRTGLDLAEVHTGYAVERTVGVGDAGADGESSDDGAGEETLTGRLLAGLSAGENCLLVGPPGSGKSTTAKRVACEWHDADRGPVLYRAAGQGRAVESVDELVAAAEASEGRALVVVEDVTRPDAAGVLAAAERVDGNDAVFLFDARESEWRDPPAAVRERLDHADLRVETVPRMLGADCARLVDHVERTAGVSVDVPVERLREEVHSPAFDEDGAAPGEMLLLLHRLATYADPLVEEETSLEADAAAVYGDLVETGELALGVGLLANLLNAAGVAVTPAHLHAVAEAGAAGDLGAALDVIDGRVLFGRADGAYRTVHEAWSTAFLDAALRRGGEAATRDRVERVLSAVLALADSPGRRERVWHAVEDPALLDRIAADPEGWADRTVEAVVALVEQRPKLAPLLGGAEGGVVELPGLGVDRTVRVGRAFADAGAYDRAEATLERVPPGERSVDSLLAMARTERRRADYDAATTAAERALDAATDEVAVARAKTELGRTKTARGDPDAARERLSEALSTLEAAGDRRRTVTCLTALGDAHRTAGDLAAATDHFGRALETATDLGAERERQRILDHLGSVAADRGEYDRARRYHRESLAVARRLGTRGDQASALNNLGRLAIDLNDLDDAEEYLTECLDLARAIDDRGREMEVLTNLATIAGRRTEYERAERLFEEALAAAEAIGDRRTRAVVLDNLGTLAERRDDLETAERRLEEGHELARAVGDTRVIARVLHDLGGVMLAREAYDDAETHLQEALDFRREAEDSRGEAVTRSGLARLALERGEYDRAEELAAESAETFADLGIGPARAEPETTLGSVTAERGDHDAAREHFEEALALYDRLGDPDGAVDVRERLADLERAAGNPDAAIEHCRQALARIDETPDLADERETIEALRDDLRASANADDD